MLKSTKFEIPKFNGKEFAMWKVKIYVIASLLSKKLKRKSLEASTLALGAQALVLEEGRGRSMNKNINRRDNNMGRTKPKKDLKCYYYNKNGHIKKDYWKLRKDLKEKDNKGHNNQDVILVHDELVIVFYYGNECLTTDCDPNWVIDSNASFHAIPSRDFFTTYEASDLGMVKMRNDSTSKIIG